jgi:hypothetical protein
MRVPPASGRRGEGLNDDTRGCYRTVRLMLAVQPMRTPDEVFGISDARCWDLSAGLLAGAMAGGRRPSRLSPASCGHSTP